MKPSRYLWLRILPCMDDPLRASDTIGFDFTLNLRIGTLASASLIQRRVEMAVYSKSLKFRE